ncbi:MAG: hypothetical protein ACPGGK_11465 [Pikeienuella sp.]
MWINQIIRSNPNLSAGAALLYDFCENPEDERYKDIHAKFAACVSDKDGLRTQALTAGSNPEVQFESALNPLETDPIAIFDQTKPFSILIASDLAKKVGGGEDTELWRQALLGTFIQELAHYLDHHGCQLTPSVTTSSDIGLNVELSCMGGSRPLFLEALDLSENAGVSPAAPTIIPSGAPRGIRNHNPGNIKHYVSNNWNGLANPPQDDGGFCVFAEAKWGLRAMARLLENYTKKSEPKNTIQKIIAIWAPKSENQVGPYVQSVCQNTSFTKDQILDLGDQEIALKLMKAMIAHECGAVYLDFYSDSLIRHAHSIR